MRAQTRLVLDTAGERVACPFLAVELDFPGAPVRAWSGVGEIAFAGRAFAGVGDLGGVSDVRESGELSAYGVTVTLSGIPREQFDLVDTVLTSQYQGRPLRIWYGYTVPPDPALPGQAVSRYDDAATFDDNGLFVDRLGPRALEVVPHPVLIWTGRMDEPVIADEGESLSVRVAAEHRLVAHERANPVRMTPEGQASRFPGEAKDRGFDYVAATVDAKVPFGRKS